MRIDLPGGWYLIRDDEECIHEGCWFLSRPDDNHGGTEGVWVAKFWDGPDTGECDAKDFAQSLGVKL